MRPFEEPVGGYSASGGYDLLYQFHQVRDIPRLEKSYDLGGPKLLQIADIRYVVGYAQQANGIHTQIMQIGRQPDTRGVQIARRCDCSDYDLNYIDLRVHEIHGFHQD